MSENQVSVEGDEKRYVYLVKVDINYEELKEYRTYLHLVETSDGLGLVLTVASNSMYATFKVASKGYKVIHTVTLLECFELMATEGVGSLLDTDEEGG
ncbi:MAG: hypothetical protein V3V85_01780 [Candidatus Thorarchaeota archaeon]